MPRKKQTRTASRKKPQLPNGDEGSSLSEEQRKKKLNMFLKDFDAQVETNLTKMKKDMIGLMEFVEKLFNFHLFNLPQGVREMSMSEFLEAGGTVDKALDYLEEKDDLADDPPDLYHPASAKLAKKIQRIRPGLDSVSCETIQEENETPMNGSRNANKRPRRTVKAKNVIGEKLPPSLPPSAYKSRNLRTPHYKSLVSAGWETPLVTPKFDPRLPMTPGQGRDPALGERIMSMQGSPLNNIVESSRNTVQFLVKGRVVPVNNIADDPSAFEDMGLDQIHKMMEVLTKVYKKSRKEV